MTVSTEETMYFDFFTERINPTDSTEKEQQFDPTEREHSTPHGVENGIFESTIKFNIMDDHHITLNQMHTDLTAVKN